MDIANWPSKYIRCMSERARSRPYIIYSRMSTRWKRHRKKYCYCNTSRIIYTNSQTRMSKFWLKIVSTFARRSTTIYITMWMCLPLMKHCMYPWLQYAIHIECWRLDSTQFDLHGACECIERTVHQSSMGLHSTHTQTHTYRMASKWHSTLKSQDRVVALSMC